MIFRYSGKGHTGSEDDLVKLFIQLFENHLLTCGNTYEYGKYYEQIRIPEIGRVSDLVIDMDGRLINIEFKLQDHKCLKAQAIDHLQWCDYSYVCVPAGYYSIYPNDFYQNMKDRGIGIILATGTTFIEILRGYRNTYKAGKKRAVRDFVVNKLNQSKPVATGCYKTIYP